MDLTLIPFLVSTLTVPIVYKFLTPKLSDGKVVLKQGSILRYALFGVCMSLAFNILFLLVYIGAAMAVAPLVRDIVNPASEQTMDIAVAVIRGVLAQCVFFVLTLLAGKFCKKTLLVDGLFSAWKAAWAPAFVVVLCMSLAAIIIGRVFVPQ